MHDDAIQLAAQIKARARELGFDLAGIASAEPSHYRDYFRQWLNDGQAGAMAYLHARFEERTDPAVYLPGAKSVICLAMNYHVPLAPPPPGAASGRVATYALGNDYHEVLKPKLHALADWLCQHQPTAQTRCAVDTAPVMEKELAARSGVGWLGKNTCLINPDIGSWLLLGEIITTAELAIDQPGIDRCGTCTRCLDACPTHAITAPYQLDATRCISYLTIERRDDFSEQIGQMLNEWVYGCDVCQQVCPWNRRAPMATEPEFSPRFPSGTLNLDEVAAWSDQDYRQTLRHSAMKRVKLPVLQRNARMVKQNARA